MTWLLIEVILVFWMQIISGLEELIICLRSSCLAVVEHPIQTSKAELVVEQREQARQSINYGADKSIRRITQNIV
jgi:hypothetical protein